MKENIGRELPGLWSRRHRPPPVCPLLARLWGLSHSPCGQHVGAALPPPCPPACLHVTAWTGPRAAATQPRGKPLVTSHPQSLQSQGGEAPAGFWKEPGNRAPGSCVPLTRPISTRLQPADWMHLRGPPGAREPQPPSHPFRLVCPVSAPPPWGQHDQRRLSLPVSAEPVLCDVLPSASFANTDCFTDRSGLTVLTSRKGPINQLNSWR